MVDAIKAYSLTTAAEEGYQPLLDDMDPLPPRRPASDGIV